MAYSPTQILKNARRVADFAVGEGIFSKQYPQRQTYEHMGAVLADSILQAGLNYLSVVLPRVNGILREFPETNRLSTLIEIVVKQQTGTFLNWRHPVKITRFESVVYFLKKQHVESVSDLRQFLCCKEFCSNMLQLNGVGLKTIDYMSCLVGNDTIAVDRHIKSFAHRAGLQEFHYIFLRKAFCCAADLLCLSRRAFDAWVWHRESLKLSDQYQLPHTTSYCI